VRHGEIRVKTEVKYRELYRAMKEHGAITDSHELFFVCACLGFSRGKREPLERADDRFWSHTISATEWSCSYAMMMQLSNFDLSVLVDDTAMVSVIQEYANAGMELLIEGFLGNYIFRSSGDVSFQLDPNCAKTLPKDFLYYILKQSGAVNWNTGREKYS
jgi:hypothetical protein